MMHCDIKEPNIMVKTPNFHEPEIVLIDFGLTRAMAADEVGKITGTPGYIPPETWEGGVWFPGGDVFSMGVCMMQILLDKIPNTESPNKHAIFREGCEGLKDIRRATQTREPPFHLMPQSMPGLTDVVQKTLEKNMSRRPRAPRVLQDTWFCMEEPDVPTADPLPKGLSWLRRWLPRRGSTHSTSALRQPNFFNSVISDEFFDAVPASSVGGA
mmetsp:Transcript_67746/g.189066  ORF Transcript_67746/g.189066 Transcript_67746/m.189066 type:complete len:213 (-) Transcript_67746:75-713(-)